MSRGLTTGGGSPDKVTGTEESGTLVAHLYDVGPLGLVRLVSHDVPSGHRLALVVNTVDPLRIEHNPSGAQLTFSSPRRGSSYVSVPLREQ
ncbi:hypothetical protein GCM10010344_41060 [Streptomyces bluensis]|nr:hypothetical protein GCM10010344_41060 [Streptomyces bluensis]